MRYCRRFLSYLIIRRERMIRPNYSFNTISLLSCDTFYNFYMFNIRYTVNSGLVSFRTITFMIRIRVCSRIDDLITINN